MKIRHLCPVIKLSAFQVANTPTLKSMHRRNEQMREKEVRKYAERFAAQSLYSKRFSHYIDKEKDPA